jgi:inhibitor of KinA sporulation pathway (predicted exonuclease)
MAISSSRFAIERQKLCTWLEGEKRKIQTLPHDLKHVRDVELEREFRARLDRLYGEQHRGAGDARTAARTKLN